MDIKKARFVSLFNGLLFVSVMLSYQHGKTFYLFGLIGLLLNICLFWKTYMLSRGSENRRNESVNRPGFSEQNEIMNDLEREMEHRREVEKFNKN